MWSVEYLLEVVKSITYNLLCLVVESLFKSLRIFIPISLNVYKILALVFLVLFPKHYCHILFSGSVLLQEFCADKDVKY